MKITADNFYFKTKATWQACDVPHRTPDFESESGSQYWYSDNGVIRYSGHWGKVSTCDWRCDSSCGFCEWNSFVAPSSVQRHTNQYGNIDCRQALPRGFCRIPQIKGIKLHYWLKKLEIPFARAFVGFDHSRGFSPKFDGYVIPSRSKPKVMEFVRQKANERK
ncbi:MAG: hypothetical protein ACIAZJ_04880 [Gimesia chilikensis]|uniref:hypothetical protein n=1 Tax=Gimesia chilikensis TaxID=2605989 RepID=UPI0037B0BC19